MTKMGSGSSVNKECCVNACSCSYGTKLEKIQPDHQCKDLALAKDRARIVQHQPSDTNKSGQTGPVTETGGICPDTEGHSEVPQVVDTIAENGHLDITKEQVKEKEELQINNIVAENGHSEVPQAEDKIVENGRLDIKKGQVEEKEDIVAETGHLVANNEAVSETDRQCDKQTIAGSKTVFQQGVGKGVTNEYFDKHELKVESLKTSDRVGIITAIQPRDCLLQSDADLLKHSRTDIRAGGVNGKLEIQQEHFDEAVVNPCQHCLVAEYDNSKDTLVDCIDDKSKIELEINYDETDPDNSADPIQALEKRQDVIFAKLQGLKATLDKLTNQYAASGATPSRESKVKSSSGASVKAPAALVPKGQVSVASPVGSGIHDVVVSADPARPPLSLFVLYELLKQRFRTLATAYVHSSVKEVDPRLCEVIRGGCQVKRGEHQIALSVIWKTVSNGPTLMISPTKQSAVTGEVNVARYINRLLSPGFDTDDIVQATYIDEWLDVANNQLFYGNSKQRAAATKNLNTRLKRNEWIVGDSFSLSDVVMWSALHQSQQMAGAPEFVKKWGKRCEDLPMFKTALMFTS